MSLKKIPKVAVLLCSFNGEKFIKEQIESIFNQSFKNLDLYIFDDGSTDNTINIIQNFAPNHNIFLKQRRKRLGPAHNFLDSLTQLPNIYDVIAFADQDNVWSNTHIENSILQLQDKVDLEALRCGRVRIIESSVHKKYYGPQDDSVLVTDSLIFENFVIGCTVAINQNLHKRIINTYSQNSYVIMHDWWIGLLASMCGVIVLSTDPTIHFRIHSSNDTGFYPDNFYGKIRRITGAISNRKSRKKQYAELATQIKHIPNSALQQVVVANVFPILVNLRLAIHPHRLRKVFMDDLFMRILLLFKSI